MTALQAIGDIRSKPKPQPPPVAAGTPAGAATPGTPGAAPNANSPAAVPQRATPVAIPPQGIHIVLPGGQSYTFTRTHLAHLQRLNTMHHQGQPLTAEQRQMMTTLYSQYTYIQKLHTQQQQQLVSAQVAGNLSHLRLVFIFCIIFFRFFFFFFFFFFFLLLILSHTHSLTHK
jgi:hypothetical protein